MELRLTRNPEELAARAERLLADRVELNVMATVLVNARAAPGDEPPLFAYGLDERGAASFAALRTPPWPLLVSGVDPPDATELMALWLAHDPDLERVCGTPTVTEAIGRAWERLTGGVSRLRMREAMHVLTEVIEPARPAPGGLRPATSADRELLIAWEEAFVAEADAGVAGQAARSVDRRLAAQLQMLWIHGGEPTSTLVLNHSIAGTVRVGVVYTPPEHRCRGYATSAVAAASRLALARGCDRCMLFTDLANPTSNRIYASVGYRRVGDWNEHDLIRRRG